MDAKAGTYLLQERDLDLMLLEELQNHEGFDIWFAERIDLLGYTCAGAEHSVSAKANAKWGETDVLAFFADGAESVAVLIEDKIAASFTERQAARYHERAAEIVKEGRAARYKTVLIAPAAYLATVPREDHWTHTVAVEDVQAWFLAKPAFRHLWRAAVLGRCLARLRPLPAPGREDIIRFGAAFSAYLQVHHAPALAHNAGKDASGPLIRFPGCSSNKTLWWKVSTRQMTLQLMGPLAGLVPTMALPEGMTCEAAADFGRSCDYLAIMIPGIDFGIPFEAQTDVVEQAITAAYRLIAMVPEIERRASVQAPQDV